MSVPLTLRITEDTDMILYSRMLETNVSS